MTDQTALDVKPQPAPRQGDRRHELGPHSRVLRRGALGRTNGNSWEGKFIRSVERDLIAHVGGQASVAQRLLIARISRALLRLDLLDEKVGRGEATELDLKIIGGLDSAVRNGLRALGLAPGAPPTPTLDEHLAALAEVPDGEAAA